MASWSDLFNWKIDKEETQPKNSKDARITDDTTSTAIETFAMTSVDLTEDDILGIPAVSAGIDTIAGSIAQLPIDLYKLDENGERVKITDDYRLGLLNSRPNSILSGYALKRKIVKDIILYGSSKSYIEYEDSESNIIQGIYPLDMSKVTVQVKTSNGYQFFGVIYLDTNAGRQVFYDDLLLSIMKDTDNGITGKGLINEHGGILRLAKGQNDYENNLLQNGATPTSVLETDQKVTNDVITRIRNSWKALYSGVKNAGKTVILEQGLHYKPISYGPDDLQLTDGKKSVISDIARILNIPESMINSSANKYDSTEQNNLWFLQTTLSPLMVAFENSLNNSLLTDEEKEEHYFFEFDSEGMNKVTTETKTDVTIKKLNAGIISVPKAAKILGESVDPSEQNYYRLTTGVAMYNPETGNIANPNTGVIMNINTGKIVKDGIEVSSEEAAGVDKTDSTPTNDTSGNEEEN